MYTSDGGHQWLDRHDQISDRLESLEREIAGHRAELASHRAEIDNMLPENGMFEFVAHAQSREAFLTRYVNEALFLDHHRLIHLPERSTPSRSGCSRDPITRKPSGSRA